MSTTPVLEVARLWIYPDQTTAFESGIAEAFTYLQKTQGYLRHQLQRCIEDESQYLLFIEWETLDAHLVNFRQSENFVQWRSLIGSYFSQPPQVLHFTQRL